MRSALWQFARIFTAPVLITAFAVPQNAFAQDSQHVVSQADLGKAAVTASQSRQKNLNTLTNFLSSDQAQKALRSAHVNPQQVKKAVAGLSDQELAQFAFRAQKAQSDFAAGGIGDHDLLLIVVLLVALILVIVAVR